MSDIILEHDNTLTLAAVGVNFTNNEARVDREGGSFFAPVIVKGELRFYNNVTVGVPRPPKAADEQGTKRVQAELHRIGTSLDELVSDLNRSALSPPRVSPVEQLRRMEPPYNIYLMLAALRAAVLQLANRM